MSEDLITPNPSLVQLDDVHKLMALDRKKSLLDDVDRKQGDSLPNGRNRQSDANDVEMAVAKGGSPLDLPIFKLSNASRIEEGGEKEDNSMPSTPRSAAARSLLNSSPSSSPSPLTSSSDSVKALFLPEFTDARFALILLTLINLLNYIDRYAPSAVKDLIEADLGLDDTESSLPLTSFIIVYMVTAPIFGYLADNGWDRRYLLTGGVCFFSLCSALSAASNSFATLMVTRSLVGVGEAAYATIGPALISEYYPQHLCNKALAIYYLAIPVGAALGYEIAGTVGSATSWRVAFLVTGVPGMILGLSCLKIKLPVKANSNDGRKRAETLPPPGWWETVKTLAMNGHFMCTQFGSAASTFGSGALADWVPTYCEQYFGMSIDEATTVIGAATVVGGIGGTTLGAWLGDKLYPIHGNSYYYVSAIGQFVAAGFIILIQLVGSNIFVLFILGTVMQIGMWASTGPSNALMSNAVHLNIRARAFACGVFVQHSLGDAISPTIVGAVSDASDLFTAMWLVPVAFGISGLIFLWGAVFFAPMTMKRKSSLLDGSPVDEPNAESEERDGSYKDIADGPEEENERKEEKKGDLTIVAPPTSAAVIASIEPDSPPPAPPTPSERSTTRKSSAKPSISRESSKGKRSSVDDDDSDKDEDGI